VCFTILRVRRNLSALLKKYVTPDTEKGTKDTHRLPRTPQDLCNLNKVTQEPEEVQRGLKNGTKSYKGHTVMGVCVCV